MTRIEGQRAGLDQWQVSQLRLTVFPAPNQEFSGGDWFEMTAGEVAHDHREQPREGTHNYSALIEDVVHSLAIEPTRITWTISPNQDILEHPIPSIGVFTELIDTFRNCYREWLENTIQFDRIAFGAMLYLPMDARLAGYKEITNYLNFDLPSDDVSDFQYSINRHQSSSIIEGLKINRLSRWSVVQFQRITIALESGRGRQVSTPSPQIHACHLLLDISTDEELKDSFGVQQVYPLFSELIDKGSEIVQEGDI